MWSHHRIFGVPIRSFYLFLFFSFPLPPLSLLNLEPFNFVIWKSCIWHLRLTNRKKKKKVTIANYNRLFFLTYNRLFFFLCCIFIFLIFLLFCIVSRVHDFKRHFNVYSTLILRHLTIIYAKNSNKRVRTKFDIKKIKDD